jgi:hypothetical protein
MAQIKGGPREYPAFVFPHCETMQKVGVCHKLHVEYVEIKSAQNNGSVE